MLKELFEGTSLKGKMIIGGVVVCVGLVGFSLFKPWITVPAGYRGVEMHFGAVQNEVLDEGIHWRLPIRDSFEMIEVREQKVEANCSAASSDLQIVNSKIALVYKIDPKTANQLYKEVGTSYDNKIVAPTIQECVKAITAKYSAEDLIKQREAVSQEMRIILQNKLNSYKMTITMFNVSDFNFSESFNNAIEAKQTAQQEALKAENELQKVQAEAKQKVEQARAEAESLRVQKEQITPEMLKLREIEAMNRAVDKWDGKLPETIMGGNGAVPFMQMNK